MKRRDLLKLGFGGLSATATALSRSASAQIEGTVRLIVPFSPGGATDVVGRLWADRMRTVLGTVVVENRGGGGGVIGAEEVVRAQPDGHTFLMGNTSTQIIVPVAMTPPPYDPLKDFSSIYILCMAPNSIVVHESVPVHTLQELIAYAKANPGQLNYGSVGIGSSQHLAGVYFAQLTGVEMTHVPYRNIGQYQPDLMAGVVQLGFQWFPNVSSALQAKGAKALAVAGANRLDALPDVPTTKEAGLPEYVVSGWFALLVPKGTPADVVTKLNGEVKSALADPDVRARFQQQGAETLYLPPDEANKFIADEIKKYHDIITKAGIPQIE
jgi:tripartite-type tricarboxylate transporter receptor subunit TctC